MAHRGFYRVRANKHEKAARSSKSARDKAGHKEIASGYRKLAGGASATHKIGRKKSRKKGRKKGRKGGYPRGAAARHRRSGRYVRSGLARAYGQSKRRAANLRNLKKARAAKRRKYGKR